MNGDKEHDNYYNRVNHNRAERVDVAHPSATQTLYIKFFEETDTRADKDGI